MNDEIVPPWLQKDSLEMRKKLQQAAEFATAAAEAFHDLDRAAEHTAAAFTALIDADFARRMIEREKQRDVDDHRPNES